MKRLLAILITLTVSLTAEARCYLALDCWGRTSPKGPTSQLEYLDIRYFFEVDETAPPPSLLALSRANPDRMDSFERSCNQERYRRTTFNSTSNTWNEDARTMWVETAIHCPTKGACLRVGSPCSDSTECCSSLQCEEKSKSCQRLVL